MNKDITNNRKLEYNIKLYNDFTEPYSYSDNNIIRHKNYDEYVIYDENTFYKILDDILDSPKKKLTEADVKKDFDDDKRKLSARSIQAIMAYYNGRFDLSKKIYSMLKKAKLDDIAEDFPFSMKVNIPFNMNYFSCEDGSEYDKNVKMNGAYLSIEVSRIAD